jgi:hypothetical protein
MTRLPPPPPNHVSPLVQPAVDAARDEARPVPSAMIMAPWLPGCLPSNFLTLTAMSEGQRQWLQNVLETAVSRQVCIFL